MANDLTTNPIVCDTAGVLKTGPTRPKALAWRATAAASLLATNLLCLSKASGAVVVEKLAVFDGDGIEMQHFPQDYECDGLTLTTIEGGILSIFF